jgi:5-methylcytosine-specific restriction endonuclease McrBC regulatory subunit McrC
MLMLWLVGWPMPQFHHLSKQLLSQHQPYLSHRIKVKIWFTYCPFILKKCDYLPNNSHHKSHKILFYTSYFFHLFIFIWTKLW